MSQEIIFNGYSANPSDYESPDGDLALSLNLIKEDSQLKPIMQPSVIHTLQEGDRLLCIHETAKFSHYIVQNSLGAIVWVDRSDLSRHATDNRLLGAVKDATPIGNTLCLLTDSGVSHYLWKSQSLNGSYVYLPESMPETRLSFGLQCEFYASESFQVRCVSDSYDSSAKTITEQEQIDRVSNRVLGAVNKFISEEINEKGKFLMPFFVRYAYRLYDGTLTRHSAPILMVPDSKGVPTVWVKSVSPGDSGYDSIFNAQLFSPTFELDYALVPNNSGNTLSQWSDIIRSIDVFVSSPIYSYDQSGEVKTLSNIGVGQSWGIYSMKGDAIDRLCDTNNVSQILKKYSYHDSWVAARSSGVLQSSSSLLKFDLPTKSDGNIKEDYYNCSNFYLLKSIPIAELTSQRTIITIDKGYLSSLVNHEVMTDDYDSHDTIIAKGSYVYNSRLILHGISKKVFDGYFEQPFSNGRLYLYDIRTKTDTATSTTKYYCHKVVDYASTAFKITEMYTHLRIDGNLSIVRHTPTSVDGGAVANYVMTPVSMNFRTGNELYVPFFYHPDSRATKVELVGTYNGNTYTLTLPLKQHEVLSGSFYFADFSPQSLVSNVASVATMDNTYHLKNKLYVSEVGNPFYYPPTSIVSVGSGSVVGVATATQALSQGQFGSFPLYAFTTEGVWALAVSNTGTFSAVQPITRDVCVDGCSITQLDGSVLFASSRGIFMISGSNVRCISEQLKGDSVYDIASMPGMQEIEAFLPTECQGCMSPSHLLRFIDGCRMQYDYIHQHVIVYNPKTDENGERVYRYALVLSLNSMLWGMMNSRLSYGVNSYPESIAVDEDNNIVNFDGIDDGTAVCLYATRPIKFASPGTSKEILAASVRGNFNGSSVVRGQLSHGDVSIALYGSRDLSNWHLISSSTTNNLRKIHGSPYRYFRFVGIAMLSNDKSMSGISVEVVGRDSDLRR